MRLYPYQEAGVRFLMERDRAYLADQMGLGKTVQAIVAARKLGLLNVLVVCPASLQANWKHEWERWADPPGMSLRTISYAKLARNIGRLDVRDDWDLVILDEAHYVKNPNAKRTQAALDVARKAKRAWLLSGTPMPNHPGELFPAVRVLWPELAKTAGVASWKAWRNHFTHWRRNPWGGGVQIVGGKNLKELGGMIKPIMLRRLTNDVLPDLPPLRLDVSFLPHDKRFVEALEELDVDAGALLKQIAYEEHAETGSLSRLRRLLGEYKAPHIARQLADELESREYEKIVVMAHHRSVLRVLRDLLEDYGVTGFDGSTPLPQRQEAIADFTRFDGSRVFVAQQTAAGVGINLQVASEIVLVEPSWSPGENRQAIMRVRRIGSESPVRARIFCVDGTVDEGVMRTIVRKAMTQQEVGL